MKKIAALLGAAALGVVLAGQAWAQEQIRIVVVMHGQACRSVLVGGQERASTRRRR